MLSTKEYPYRPAQGSGDILEKGLNTLRVRGWGRVLWQDMSAVIINSEQL